MFAAYAANDSRRICLRSLAPLVSLDAPVVWVDVAPIGTWRGHHGGEFAFTRETFERMLANHRRQKTPPPVDFDHERDFLPPGTPVPARGYVHELAVREVDGTPHLFARVELGRTATEHVRSGGYRFCSAVVDFDARDRVTGKPIGPVLRSLALTADPFIDGQAPIRLTRGPSTMATPIVTRVPTSSLIQALEASGDDISRDELGELFEQLVGAGDSTDVGESSVSLSRAQHSALRALSARQTPEARAMAREAGLSDAQIDASWAKQRSRALARG